MTAFAIPSNTVRTIVSQLLETSTVRPRVPRVGVATIPPPPHGRWQVAGVAVDRCGAAPCRGSGPARVDRTRTVSGTDYPTGGDVITEVDEQAVASADDLRNAIDAKRPGDSIEVMYARTPMSHRRGHVIVLAERPR